MCDYVAVCREGLGRCVTRAFRSPSFQSLRAVGGCSFAGLFARARDLQTTLRHGRVSAWVVESPIVCVTTIRRTLRHERASDRREEKGGGRPVWTGERKRGC